MEDNTERVGLYPGSFNKWHVGHQDILEKALKVFDRVVVLVCQNPEKPENKDLEKNFHELHDLLESEKVSVMSWRSSIIGFLETWSICEDDKGDIVAMIRGLRNGYDLEYEIAQMGLHEDTGNNLPFVCFLTDRKYGHVSSSAARALDKINLKHSFYPIKE